MTFGFLTIEKSIYVHRSCSFSIQSVLENGLIPGGRESVSSSHHLTLLMKIPTKKNPLMITQFLRKCTTTVIGHVTRMPLIREIVQSTRFGTAILADEVTCNHVHIPVPADRIYMAISQNGERILFERLSTP